MGLLDFDGGGGLQMGCRERLTRKKPKNAAAAGYYGTVLQYTTLYYCTEHCTVLYCSVLCISTVYNRERAREKEIQQYKMGVTTTLLKPVH